MKVLHLYLKINGKFLLIKTIRGFMKIERIIQLGYYPVRACDIGEGAQIVNGQWYMPRWGCNTMQYIIDKWGTPNKQHCPPR